MKMSDEISLPVSQDIAWKALNDVSLLQVCIPGCEAINLQEDGSYEILIAAAVGPIRAKFKGEMRMKNIVEPTSYQLEFSMQGGAGFGRGDASVELSAVDAETTLLKYTTSANVGGKLAQVGARLIDMTAKKMAGQFFEAFRKQLVARYCPGTAAEAEAASLERAPNGAAPAASVAPVKRLADVRSAPAAPSTPPEASTSKPASEGTLILKIEVTLIDQTSSRQKSALGRWLAALCGR